MGDTLRGYAGHAGVHPNAALKWKKAGYLVFDTDGTIDREASDERRAKMTDPSYAGGRGRIPNGQSAETADMMQRVRVAREGFDVKIRELDYLERKGKVHDVETCNASRFAEGRRARNLLAGIAARLAPVVAGLVKELDCYNAIEEEVLRVSQELGEPDGTTVKPPVKRRRRT